MAVRVYYVCSLLQPALTPMTVTVSPTSQVGKDLRLSAGAVSRALTRRTIAVVVSTPSFPHGVMDHVEAIARVTRRLVE